MGIFSKKKAVEKGKAVSSSEKPSTDRKMYMPRYAERDGMIGRPTGYKEEEQEAFQRAYQSRMSREMSESSWSLPNTNPKMSPRMSRNSSAMSLDWQMHAGHAGPSSPSAHRQSNPFATPLSTRPSSFQSLPHIMADGPPVPAVPQQYASQVPTPISHGSRNSSFISQPPPMLNQYNRPRVAQRNSFQPAASPLGRTPEASVEVTPVDTPLASATHSSAASTASSASGEAIEIPSKHDGPAQYRIDNMNREYPHDPRQWDMTSQTPRTYFTHPAKAETPAAPKPAPAPVKKNRFSLMRRSQAVAAH